MPITAKVVKHSVNPLGKEICSLQLFYPRYIHPEFLTHRVFSRSASSSRAVPITKLIQEAIDNPAYPVHFGLHQPGMQAMREAVDKERAMNLWLSARDDAVRNARLMQKMDLHKQVVNRVLEPFTHINVIVTSTEWDNFFELRNHRDAQPEIQALAKAMYAAMQDSKPTELDFGGWHLPYVSEEEEQSYYIDELLMMSVARCARVSYNNHDGSVPSPEKDFALYRQLVGSQPLHASPAEHQAISCRVNDGCEGNFVGWGQYRKYLERMMK